MTEETHLVDYASLLVTPLKQNALVKIAETLIRHELEEFCHIRFTSVNYEPFQRFSANIEQLCIPKSCQDDIGRMILCLYRNLQNMDEAKFFLPSTVKFKARGEVDVHGTFDDFMKQWICSPPPSQQCLLKYLRDACGFQQGRCVQSLLCELMKCEQSELEPKLRNAKREVKIAKQASFYQFVIRFVVDDVDDSAPWKLFASMLTNNLNGIKCSFTGNLFIVSTRQDTCIGMTLLWPKIEEKYEDAAWIFEIALQHSDICLLVLTMRYVDSSKRTELIKRNLVSFILSFFTHFYYRNFLPDLQLVEEDLQLVQKENELRVFEQLVKSLASVGDFTAISDCLVELWRYVSSRDKSLGDHVHRNIKAFVYGGGFNHLLEQWGNSDSWNALMKLYMTFPPE